MKTLICVVDRLIWATALAISLLCMVAAIEIALAPSLEIEAEASPIPWGYYHSACQQPASLTFHDWMTTLQIPPYKTDAFDCSQMSAYIEWLAENCGHKATLVGAYGDGWGHIWVLIDIGNVPFAYESTWAEEALATRSPWVPREYGWGHYEPPDTKWENIYETPWENDRFEMEYAWWLTYPSLVTDQW